MVRLVGPAPLKLLVLCAALQHPTAGLSMLDLCAATDCPLLAMYIRVTCATKHHAYPRSSGWLKRCPHRLKSSEFVVVHPKDWVSTMEIQLFAKDRWSVGCPIIAQQISWFKGKDVATSLEYGNTRDALQRHVEPEDKTTYSELSKGVGKTDALANQQPHEI